MGHGGNMMSIFHFFAIKICQLLLFGRTKRWSYHVSSN